jgi:glutaminyl-peptide cyclotransferase
MKTITASLMAFMLLGSVVACVSSASAQRTNQQPAPSQSALKVLSTDFSGNRAYDLLKKQVGFGPRVPGTNAHSQCRDLIKAELAPYCTGITEQSFQRSVNGRDYTFHNVIANIHPNAPKLVILAAHFDCRPFADQDTPRNYSTPIPGANDGASGVAVLLELSRMLDAKLPDTTGVVFLFTDGEDTGRTTSQMFVGAKYYASNMPHELKKRVAFGVLLDMVGDINLNIKPERNSEGVASGVYAALLDLQEMMGLRGFQASGQYDILDDHLSFIDQGIKMYDVIDFDYPFWHTLDDTPDKCSADSLRTVGLCVGNLVLNYASGKLKI